MFEATNLPSLENLRCFLAAAEHLNFRRASESVNLTPAAFGQRIRQLEDNLGYELFARTTRTVNLTEAGHRLVPAAKATLREAMACRDALDEDNPAPIRLMVGTRFELGCSYLVPAIIDLPEELSHIEFDLYFGSGADILDRLTKGKLDCLITSAPQAHRDWAAEFLHREDYAFVATPEYLEKHPFDPNNAGNHLLFDINDSLALGRYLTSISSTPLEFAGVRGCGTTQAIRMMVRASLGVAVLPAYLIGEDLDHGDLVQIMPDLQLLSDSFRLLYPKDSLFGPAIRKIAEYLRSRPLR